MSETTDRTPPAYAPHPGSEKMPPWNVGKLIDAPRFDWRKWFQMLGPGLLLGGAAIGGGEWLMGPTVTARYGGALMWLATLSIVAQVVYNIEISRYALYTGEPIFTGKFRTMPGPLFWLGMYLILDFGSVFPYLAANAATPVAAIWLGEMPDPRNPSHEMLLRMIAYGVFLLSFVPLIFGGKVYNTLKAVMTFKIFAVLGFLGALAIFYSSLGTWGEIFSGFVKFGNVPVRQAEDTNGNGVFDAGEDDWDNDGHPDRLEPEYSLAIDSDGDGTLDSFDMNGDGEADVFILVDSDVEDEMVLVRRAARYWPDFDGDGEPDAVANFVAGNEPADPLELEAAGTGETAAGVVMLDLSGDRVFDSAFVDYDGDRIRDGDGIQNVFVNMAEGKPWPDIDFSMIAFLAAFAAIAGSGGLSNAPISNYTRDQGWGMGHHVGAIPSVVGGHDIQLSHVGTVFLVEEEVLPRWKRWYKHVVRDQVVVWMPACFLGIALPSMLSVEFLRRGTVANQWTAAGMTADGVFERVASQSGMTLANIAWFMTLFCGFLVLAPSMAATIDGFVRRWVDVFWTSSPKLRKLETHRIRNVYFAVLVGYAVFGLIMLTINRPLGLIVIATNIMNFALGFSCWHTLAVNKLLLPKELRPGWFMSLGLFFSGLFFWVLATITALKNFNLI